MWDVFGQDVARRIAGDSQESSDEKRIHEWWTPNLMLLPIQHERTGMVWAYHHLWNPNAQLVTTWILPEFLPSARYTAVIAYA